MGSTIRLFIAIAVMIWGQLSYSSEVFYWSHNSQTNLRFSSPLAVCQDVISRLDITDPAPSNIRIGPINQYFRATCQFDRQRDSGTYICGGGGGSCGGAGAAVRVGECVEPNSYNSETGECEPPPQDCSNVSPGIFKSPSGPVINSNGINYVASGFPSDTTCYGGCRYSISSSASSCYFNSGSANSGFCNYIGTGNGESCSGADAELGAVGDPLNPPSTPDAPPSDPNDPGCPDGYGWSGTTCAKNPDDNGNPGTGDGGDGGDSGGNGDGDNGGGGSGGGNNGGGNGSGDNGGNGNGSGTGDGDTGGNGSGNGSGNGDGGGEGEGDGECDPRTDPGQCQRPSVEGEACDTELKCEGDVIQCAILRKNKEQLCQWVYNDQVRSEIAAELSGEDYHLDEKSIAVSGLFAEAVNKGRWLPQSCPSPQSFSVMGRSYSFSWEPACRFAEAIGPLIVALASIFFAVFIGRGIKGS